MQKIQTASVGVEEKPAQHSAEKHGQSHSESHGESKSLENAGEIKENESKNGAENGVGGISLGGFSVASILVIVLALFVFYNAFGYSHNILWWDETEYALIAQNVHQNGEFNYWPGFQGWLIEGSHRPPLLPLNIASFYDLFGKNEAALRAVVPFFSALGVLAVFLVARRLFNEWAGLIAAGLLSFNTLYWFYSSRVLTEAPLVFFSAITFYLFYRIFEEKKWHWLPLLALFASLGFLMKYTILAIFAPFALFIIIYYHKQILENITSIHFIKNAGLALATFALVASPVFIYSLSHTGSATKALQAYLEATSGSEPILYYLTIISHIFSNFSVVLLVAAGALIAFFSWDKRGLQLAVLFGLTLIILSVAVDHKEDRYAMLFYPFAFALAGFAAHSALKEIAKIKTASEASLFKLVAVLAAIAMLYAGTIGNISPSQALIDAKISSYNEVALAGAYLSTKMQPSDTMIADSFFMASYYSGRRSDLLPTDAASFLKQIKDFNPTYIWFSAYQHGGQQLYEASSALQANATPPDSPGAYVLTHPNEYALEKVIEDGEKRPFVFLFKKIQ